MARFYGKVGFCFTQETEPGVFEEVNVARAYYGDIIKRSSRYSGTSTLNDDINITNEFSIVGDAFSYQNFAHMRYVEYMGAKWKVSNVQVEHPRLILSTSGLYNEGLSNE